MQDARVVRRPFTLVAVLLLASTQVSARPPSRLERMLKAGQDEAETEEQPPPPAPEKRKPLRRAPKPPPPPPVDGAGGPQPSSAPVATSTPLHSMAAEVRLARVLELGRSRDADAGPSLVRVLVDDPSVDVRARAAWALGRVRHQPAVPALRAALSGDGARPVRRAAALALGDIGGAEAVDTLAGFVVDEDEQVAAAAVEGLGRARPAAIPRALQDASRDPRPLVGLTAKRTLALLRPAAPPRAVTPPLAAPWCSGDAEPPDCRFRPRAATLRSRQIHPSPASGRDA